MGTQTKLKADERVVMICKAACAIRRPRRPLWQGDLHLTNKRLVWKRHGFTPPFPKPDSIEIGLDEITHIKAQDLAGAFGTLQVYTRGQEYSFIPYRGLLPVNVYFNGKLARDLARNVNELRTSENWGRS